MRRRRGFTLIEVLVTTVLVSVAVVSVLTAIRAIGNTDANARTADLLQRLAAEKMNELRVLPDPAASPGSGDFSDRGHGDVTWAVEVSNTAAEDVEEVTVTTSRGPESQSLSTMIYISSGTGGS